jgi:carboxyl-terminal processing protease
MASSPFPAIIRGGGNIVVIAPIEGTPAWKLGIQSGDVISRINGESTVPISSYEAMQKLRGDKGTEVTITIVREGLDKPFDLTIRAFNLSEKYRTPVLVMTDARWAT